MRIRVVVAIVAGIAALTAAVSVPNGAISTGSGAGATPRPAGKLVIVDAIGLKHGGRAEART